MTNETIEDALAWMVANGIELGAKATGGRDFVADLRAARDVVASRGWTQPRDDREAADAWETIALSLRACRELGWLCMRECN